MENWLWYQAEFISLCLLIVALTLILCAKQLTSLQWNIQAGFLKNGIGSWSSDSWEVLHGK